MNQLITYRIDQSTPLFTIKQIHIRPTVHEELDHRQMAVLTSDHKRRHLATIHSSHDVHVRFIVDQEADYVQVTVLASNVERCPPSLIVRPQNG